MSFKVLNSNDKAFLKSWIKYLVALLLVTNLEKSASVLLELGIVEYLPEVPFTLLAFHKNLFVLSLNLWLFNPYTQGYIIVFNQFIEPFVSSKRQVNLDVASPVVTSSPPLSKLNLKQRYPSLPERRYTVIFESTINVVLQRLYLWSLACLNAIFQFDKPSAKGSSNVKHYLPFIYRIFKPYYLKLKLINQQIKHLEKKYQKRLRHQTQGFTSSWGTSTSTSSSVLSSPEVNKRNSDIMKDFFNDLNESDGNNKRNSKGSNSSKKTNKRDSYGKQQQKRKQKLMPLPPAYQNLYVEYLIHLYKEKSSISLSFNTLLSLVTYTFNFLTNYALFVVYRLMGIKLQEKRTVSKDIAVKSDKRVSFLETKPSKETAASALVATTATMQSRPKPQSSMTVPCIQLTPASPNFPSLEQKSQQSMNNINSIIDDNNNDTAINGSASGLLTKVLRKHSRSMGAADSKTTLLLFLSAEAKTGNEQVVGRKRRNSFKDFLKSSTTRFGKIDSSTESLNIRSNSLNNHHNNSSYNEYNNSTHNSEYLSLNVSTGAAERPRKVSTIDETSLLDEKNGSDSKLQQGNFDVSNANAIYVDQKFQPSQHPSDSFGASANNLNLNIFSNHANTNYNNNGANFSNANNNNVGDNSAFSIMDKSNVLLVSLNLNLSSATAGVPTGSNVPIAPVTPNTHVFAPDSVTTANVTANIAADRSIPNSPDEAPGSGNMLTTLSSDPFSAILFNNNEYNGTANNNSNNDGFKVPRSTSPHLQTSNEDQRHKHRSFTLFKKLQHGDSPGIDTNLASNVASTTASASSISLVGNSNNNSNSNNNGSNVNVGRISTETRRGRHDSSRNSLVNMIRTVGGGFRSSSPPMGHFHKNSTVTNGSANNAAGSGKLGNRLNSTVRSSIGKESNDDSAGKKNVHEEAYQKLIGSPLPLETAVGGGFHVDNDSSNAIKNNNNNHVDHINAGNKGKSDTKDYKNDASVAKESHLEANDKVLPLASVATTTTNTTANTTTHNNQNMAINRDAPSHQSQQSMSSVGVNFVHSFTPGLSNRNIDKMSTFDSSTGLEAESIDYLTYQHPGVNPFINEPAIVSYINSNGIGNGSGNGGSNVHYRKLPLHLHQQEPALNGEGNGLDNGNDKEPSHHGHKLASIVKTVSIKRKLKRRSANHSN